MAAPASPQQQQSAVNRTSAATTSFTNDPSAFYSQSPTIPGLSTFNGPTGFAQPSSAEPTSNLPFDPRSHRVSAHGASGGFTPGVTVQNGLMSTTGPDGRTYSCFFEFNPTEIDIAYMFDDSVIGALNPIYIPATAAGTQSQGLMLNQTISFTLMFDRTYEVWTGPAKAPNASGADGDPTSGKGPYRFGVQWDVWAIERLVGIFGQWNGSPPSGPPAASLCTVQFGGKNLSNLSSFTNPQNPQGYNAANDVAADSGYAMAFQGWMTSLEVTYTRFDAGMVPTRAAVSVAFEQIYSLQAQASANPPSSPSPNTAAGSG